ncbi:hypothetical protein EVAR_23385_1 [Eumeta japonica]|uniref:Uncharacterized protein n=1 Tax=Eumeta variegata TaxID=151549 RepID=A0A4C1VY37_EUMVA|nr:hypothetical protein EVAR_23385_1 [Eumeta japonica]
MPEQWVSTLATRGEAEKWLLNRRFGILEQIVVAPVVMALATGRVGTLNQLRATTPYGPDFRVFLYTAFVRLFVPAVKGQKE